MKIFSASVSPKLLIEKGQIYPQAVLGAQLVKSFLFRL